MTIGELRAFCLALPGTHGVDDALVRGVIIDAWRRTAPKEAVAEFDAAIR